MTRDEQIQEMAKIIYELELLPELWLCDADTIATELYSKDYRKVERGEWRGETDEEEPDPMFKLVVCRVCEKTANERYNFCPNCGADMSGE